ncbi:MAG: helix-turn-helix transcriptional regulator [Clostridia bacterium]|nr:helix-turn-helix transcriptional regulator [Clostridia bacterium]
MAKGLFLIKGNICGDRVRLGRALQNPPMMQEDLARKIQLMGMDMTALIISRIEQNKRHVCDAELRMLAKALDVSMDWLCGDSNEINLK